MNKHTPKRSLTKTKKNIVLPRVVGWYEEYHCGCVSKTVLRRKDLLGYCAKHGEDRRHIHKDVEWREILD